jgi:pSer/pThr/pTyr-binding forkhead associated (FHA) protein
LRAPRRSDDDVQEMTDGLPQAAARSTGRASAARAAKGLLDRGRPKDAVALLAAWAANGANDVEGQGLLAEALRIDPGSRLAKLAFERMEGMTGDHAELEAAIAEWSPQAIERIEQEIARPAFRRAQVGFNNNVKYKNQTFHIQTEDSGLDKPHVITHLFADGGRVIKSHKRLYTEHVGREDVAAVVRQLMKGQQLEMALALRDGKFDRIIEGKAIGGMELLEHPPKVDVQKLATQKKTRVTAAADGADTEQAAASTAAPPVGRAAKEDQRAHFRLVVTRSLGGGPDTYEPKGIAAIIGAAGTIRLPGERFCHPREAEIRVRDGRLWLSDFETGNGVFVRTRAPVELSLGDEFVVGDQLLRVERNPVAQDGPGPGPTYFYSSPKWPSSFRVVQIFEGGALGASVLAHGTTLQIGSSQGDFVFPSDPLVSDQHCFIEETAGTILLTDLDSRTGVFVRIKGEQELVNGDELLVGRTRLSVERL